MLDRQMLSYNAIDSAITYAAYKEIWPLLEGGYQDTYDFTARLLYPLLYMQTRGILVNEKRLTETRTRVRDELATKEALLNEQCGRTINARSTQDLQRYFYIEKKIPPYTNRKTGRPTTDDTALARLARGPGGRAPIPEAKTVQEIRALSKYLSTYLEVTYDSDGRLRCSVNPRGTGTGRLSTSETILGNGTNMQNLPEQFRSFLEADPGYVLLEMDKKGAEWVVVAYLSNDQNMIHVVESGIDPHVYTAQMIFDCPEELILLENAIIGHLTDPVDIELARMQHCPEAARLRGITPNMSMRQAGKKSNHGLNYGEGYGTFALQNGMKEGDAKRVVEGYHRGYPGIKQGYHKWVERQLQHSRTLENCFGRKRNYLGAWNDNLFRAAYSFIPQSTICDMVYMGIIETYEDPEPKVQKMQHLMQVHDSILCQYPAEDITGMAWAIHKMNEAMSPVATYNGHDFTLPTELTIGTNWGDMRRVELTDDLELLEEKLESAVNECEAAR